MANTAGAFVFPTAECHPAHPMADSRPVEQEPTESALDHGIEESFPASDPVSVGVSRVLPRPPKAEKPEAQARPKAPGAVHGLSKGTWVGWGATLAFGLALGRMMARIEGSPRSRSGGKLRIAKRPAPLS